MDMPQGIDSKFRFILVAAKRARQLQAGARSLIQAATKKPTKKSTTAKKTTAKKAQKPTKKATKKKKDD